MKEQASEFVEVLRILGPLVLAFAEGLAIVFLVRDRARILADLKELVNDLREARKK